MISNGQKKIQQIEKANVTAKVKFSLKLNQNNILDEGPRVKSVFLMMKIKSEYSFYEMKMQNTGPARGCDIYHHRLIILKNEEYQYFYKVNSHSEKEYRHYKFDPNLENGIDEWNQIWIGYRFNHGKQVIEQQLNLGNEIFKPQKQFKPVFLEQFKLVESCNLLKKFDVIGNTDQNNQSEQLVLRSNYLIFEFSEEFIYDLLCNTRVKNQNEDIYVAKIDLEQETKYLKNKYQNTSSENQNEDFDFLQNQDQVIKPFKANELIHQFTKNLNKILEELLQDTNQLINEIISNLLTPIENPQIINSPNFQKCQQSLILINNKLKDLKQNKQKIQDQYDVLKIAYDQEQQLSQNQNLNSMSLNINEDQYKDKERQIQFLKQKFELHQNYTNNLNSILQELVEDTKYISDQQISNLLTPIEIPQINDQIFEKCKQSLININNKLKDLQQNQQRIQDQYNALKIACDQTIQKLGDYEQITQKNDKNLIIIKKLKQVLIEKQDQIEKLKKEKNQELIQYKIRIGEIKKQYQEEIEKLEKQLIDQIEQKDSSTNLNKDANTKIKLLEIDQARLEDLI